MIPIRTTLNPVVARVFPDVRDHPLTRTGSCAVCGEPFEDGDDIACVVMGSYDALGDEQTHYTACTLPVHVRHAV